MQPLKIFLLICLTLITTGCSVFGESGVEIAPYKILQIEEPFELRHYGRLVLVTTSMSGMEDQNTSFAKLFNYISGTNENTQDIPMTAPVFMDQNNQNSETMSFVLPSNFSYTDAPKPKDPSVKLEEITDYTVAAITFNGFLRQDNIEKHKNLLKDWIEKKQLKVIGPAKAAGYNPPFTIPAFRRNEILIPVKKP